MPEDRELVSFARSLADDVRDRALSSTDGEEFSEIAFVELVAEHLAEIGMLDNPVACHHVGRFGNGVLRLSGYAAPDESDRLDLLIALFEGDEQARTIPAAEIARAAGQAARALQSAMRGDYQEMEQASDPYIMMQRLAEILNSGLREVRVFVLTDGLTTARAVPPSKAGDITVRIEVYDLQRLMRTMTSGQSREVLEIDLREMNLDPVPCVTAPAAGGMESYMAVFSGEALYRLYEEFGPRLLEYNVRAFLQATGKVNRGIRDTLRDEPQHFLAYNNGISVTVDEVVTEAGKDGLMITHLKGMQIVNGGQTTASIHRARRRDRLDLSRVFVAAKITRLPSEAVEHMVPQISRFANTQNVIQEADFSSNEPYHISLEHLSKTVWAPGERTRWFYERSRGQYRTAMHREGNTDARLRRFKERTPPARRFGKPELARALNSWSRLPHVVSGGAQKNFVAFMKLLREQRGASWEPDEACYRDTVAQIILFAAAQRIVKTEAFPAYRANIACYLVAYLSHRTGGRLQLAEIWRQQTVSPSLEQLMRRWSHDISQCIQTSAAGRNVTEWCKKEACWTAVRSLNLALTVPSPPEWGEAAEDVDTAGDGHATAGDIHASAATCMQLQSEAWHALHVWGRRSGTLPEWQCGVALTLSSYASGNWQKTPSPKQAKHGIAIIESARAAGYDPLLPADVERMREAA